MTRTKTSMTIVLAGAALFTVAACTDNNPADMPPGKYERTSSSTDANGTEHDYTTKTDVTTDANGHKTATQETDTTTDPPGLFNKSTSTNKSTYSSD